MYKAKQKMRIESILCHLKYSFLLAPLHIEWKNNIFLRFVEANKCWEFAMLESDDDVNWEYKSTWMYIIYANKW